MIDPKKLRSKKVKHPRFARPNVGRTDRKRLKDVWRRPRGIDNKQKSKHASAGYHPAIGYSNPRVIRGLHPSGRVEVLVCSPKELDALVKDKDNIAVRFSASLGKRAREQMLKKAETLGLKVLN